MKVWHALPSRARVLTGTAEKRQATMADVMDRALRWSEQDAWDFEQTLTPESLAAIMRATWTWDDRALRRDLSQLLVDLAAARAVELTLPRELATAHSLRAILRRRNLAAAARFLGHVLGPRLVADSGQSNTFELAEVVLAAPSLQLPPEAERNAMLEIAGHASTAGRAEHEALTPDPGVTIAPSHGGQGGGATELAVVMRHLGRTLEPSPVFAAAALAIPALRLTGDQQAAADLLPDVAAGRRTLTLAAAERGGSWDPALVRCRAERSDSGWVLTGTKSLVPDATTADILLVVARTTAGPSLFVVEAGDPGVQAVASAVLDHTRPLGDLELTGATGRLVGRDGSAGTVMSRVLEWAVLALGAEQVGSAERCLQLVVEELDGRQHVSRDALLVLAEIYLQLESARAIVAFAAEQVDQDAQGAAAAAARAHLRCSQAATSVVRRAIDVLGEKAIQDAHPLLGQLRRVTTSELLFGGPAVAHERLLERLGI
jgi:alkylation response protein AidB-like acyl-CoA dehydrogenase